MGKDWNDHQDSAAEVLAQPREDSEFIHCPKVHPYWPRYVELQYQKRASCQGPQSIPAARVA